MIIDGKALAQTIRQQMVAQITGVTVKPRLAIFTCAPNFETQKFLMIKERQASEVGVTLIKKVLPDNVTLPEVERAIAEVLPECDGIVIQFPFPRLATADLLSLIPVTHDVDVLQYTADSVLLPPVVGAIDEMAKTYGINWQDSTVVVVGNGRLVGAPAVTYAEARGAKVTLLTRESEDRSVLKSADIIILGAGVPGLLMPDMVKEGVVIFDAGTSEEGGVLTGDAHASVAEKASLFTPVPGGIGPVTVAILLRNVLYLALKHRK